MNTKIDFDALPAVWHRGFYARINGDLYNSSGLVDQGLRAHWQTGWTTADNRLADERKKSADSSWQGCVDRQGGSFDAEEFQSNDGWANEYSELW